MKTYQEYCEKFWAIRKECLEDLTEVLNKRGVDYINVAAYTSSDAIDENPCVPMTDKHGYGTNCTIDHIRKENGKWVADLVDEDEDPFDDGELADAYYFDTSVLIDVYGMVLSIFEYADEYNDGRVCGEGEDLDDFIDDSVEE